MKGVSLFLVEGRGPNPIGAWLNPTPHAIAVYASQPLSPVATQHSLPSGRYSLLGPDFHRLDRTSLRLAHLFDHFIGTVTNERWRKWTVPGTRNNHRIGDLAEQSSCLTRILQQRFVEFHDAAS